MGEVRPSIFTHIGGVARYVRGAGARDEGLGRDAADIDAGPAEKLALNDDGFPTQAQRRGPRGRPIATGAQWPGSLQHMVRHWRSHCPWWLLN